MSARRGVVYLVGAGPGDPGLITVRGAHLLRIADVVLHDWRIAPELLSEVRRGAEIINVGKRAGAHRVSQEEINKLLVDRARAGCCVVRLKGGDPFVFGRGQEERVACRRGGVDCVLIPGVSSALAGPVAAGIPITSRRFVRSVAMITGTVAEDSEVPEPDYVALSKMDTIIILMGRANLADIASSLVRSGAKPSTPAACIEQATTPQQRSVLATLGTIAAAADRAGLRAPVVTVIGRVAAESGATDAVITALGPGESHDPDDRNDALSPLDA